MNHLSLLHRLGRRLRQSGGFTMPVVVSVMLVGSAISLAVYAAAFQDIRLAEDDVDRKRALAAAEAGLADYVQRLAQDNEVWLKCTTGLAPQPNGRPAPVNQPWNGQGADPREWRTMATEASAAYTIELLPRPGYSECVPNVDASMADSSGMIRIRVTGRAGAPGRVVKRSLVATLRRNGFLDFIYFTEFETSDPAQFIIDTGEVPVKPCGPSSTCGTESLSAWAARIPGGSATGCQQTIQDGRDLSSNYYKGSVYTSFQRNGTWVQDWRPVTAEDLWARCKTIQFAAGDAVRGPLHSNDTITVCGQPKLGRNRSGATTEPVDKVEYYGHRAATDSGCTINTPDLGSNTLVSGANLDILKLPETNGQLRGSARPEDVYFGRTTIELLGDRMRVNGVEKPIPANGLVFVANGTGVCPPWSVLRPYAAGQEQCGDVLVKGTHSKSLTIGADRDVIVTGNVTGTNNALLGLIANNYVRVHHPVGSYTGRCDADTAETLARHTRTIEAAILSLGHVFTVDNYQCGDDLGTLRVKGAIAQKYRGPVGTGYGSTVVTGYLKDYVYDDRLRFRSPPHFLAPVQSAWRVVRATERVPAR